MSRVDQINGHYVLIFWINICVSIFIFIQLYDLGFHFACYRYTYSVRWDVSGLNAIIDWLMVVRSIMHLVFSSSFLCTHAAGVAATAFIHLIGFRNFRSTRIEIPFWKGRDDGKLVAFAFVILMFIRIERKGGLAWNWKMWILLFILCSDKLYS